MQLSPQQIAETFSHHHFEATFEYLADNIRWINVDGDPIDGKGAVIKACQESANYLANIKTEFSKFEVLTGENFVVIQSLAQYIGEETFNIASCDIYKFVDGLVSEITSYNLELD